MSDGKRKITSISELNGFENGSIKQREIFSFKQTGITETNNIVGEFTLHEYVPKVYKKFKNLGIDTVDDMFEPFMK